MAVDMHVCAVFSEHSVSTCDFLWFPLSPSATTAVANQRQLTSSCICLSRYLCTCLDKFQINYPERIAARDGMFSVKVVLVTIASW